MTDQHWVPTARSRFAALRSRLAISDEDALEVGVPDLPVPAFLGADTEGSRWVRIECDPRLVATDELAAAVKFSVRKSGYRVAVSSTVAESIAVHFLEEILQLLAGGHEPGEAGRIALQNWRELIASPPGSPLSENALAGLFGELEVLETIMRHPGGDLAHWTGWSKDHNDFRLPGLVLEVKTTTSPDYRRVRIHGLRQLARPEDGSDLVLVLRRLELSPEGRSVPDVIDSIVRTGVPRSKLLECLSRVDYSEQHRPQYEHVRFVSEQLSLRRVDDDHPRLTPEILRPIDLAHIDKVDYELNLNDDTNSDLDTSLDDLIAGALDN